jgi:hypothetical protein
MASEDGSFASWSSEIIERYCDSLPQFNIEHQEVCRGCTLGKYTKIVFPNNDSRSAGVLDLIHIDVCGPMS